MLSHGSETCRDFHGASTGHRRQIASPQAAGSLQHARARPAGRPRVARAHEPSSDGRSPHGGGQRAHDVWAGRGGRAGGARVGRAPWPGAGQVARGPRARCPAAAARGGDPAAAVAAARLHRAGDAGAEGEQAEDQHGAAAERRARARRRDPAAPRRRVRVAHAAR
eukprot:2385501-Prymnesium_polylepis.1